MGALIVTIKKDENFIITTRQGEKIKLYLADSNPVNRARIALENETKVDVKIEKRIKK